MRYNDKKTQKSWVKQIEKEDVSKSDRNLRRERERSMQDFSNQVSLCTDRDWWDCVTPEQKQTLYSTWISFKFRTKFSGEQITLDTLGKWINQRKSEVIIDKALYREKKINRVIND